MRYLLRLLMLLLFISPLYGLACAAEVDTAFSVVKYPDEALLRTFNKKVGSGGFGFGSDSSGTPVETTRKQVDQLIGRVQEILDMRPANLHITIEIFETPEQVQAVYLKEYGHKVDFIAFYSPHNETIYLSSKKLRRTVFAHEIAHAVIDRYFGKAPPVKIHELLAQFVEQQL